MVFTQYRILAFILIPLLIGGVSYFYGYQAASNKCRAEAEEALSGAIEEAKKNGAQDKKLAEKAIKDYNETKGRLDEIVEDVKQAAEATPNPNCVITDDELLRLNSF